MAFVILPLAIFFVVATIQILHLQINSSKSLDWAWELLTPSDKSGAALPSNRSLPPTQLLLTQLPLAQLLHRVNSQVALV